MESERPIIILLERRGRSRKQPRSPQPSMTINRMTYNVPNGWHKLPFVDNVRSIASKHGLGIRLGKRKGLIDIADTFAMAARSPRFSAPFRPRYFHGTKDLEIATHLFIDDAGDILITRRQFVIHRSSPFLVFSILARILSGLSRSLYRIRVFHFIFSEFLTL